MVKTRRPPQNECNVHPRERSATEVFGAPLHLEFSNSIALKNKKRNLQVYLVTFLLGAWSLPPRAFSPPPPRRVRLWTTAKCFVMRICRCGHKDKVAKNK